MTPNEATLIGGIGGAGAGALLGAIVSIFTTRYIVNHGPNYEEQMEQLSTTIDVRFGQISSTLDTRIAQVVAAQEAHTKQQIEHREALAWRPASYIESKESAGFLTNTLHLVATEPFQVTAIRLQGKNDATIEILVSEPTEAVTHYACFIPPGAILRVKQSHNLGGLQHGATGRIAYTLLKGGKTINDFVPFTTKDRMVGNTICTALQG